MNRKIIRECPEYVPRNNGKCGLMRSSYIKPIASCDNHWKYGYYAHRLSAFGPNSWKNGVGEYGIYGPKDEVEHFGGYGAGNSYAYNFPANFDYSCGFKSYMLY
jgi:hypothetical protein